MQSRGGLAAGGLAAGGLASALECRREKPGIRPMGGRRGVLRGYCEPSSAGGGCNLPVVPNHTSVAESRFWVLGVSEYGVSVDEYQAEGSFCHGVEFCHT